MIIKLKCVSNIGSMGGVSDYLTVGKIYDAKQLPTGLYEVIDDDGDVISTLVSGSVHGKWELVE